MKICLRCEQPFTPSQGFANICRPCRSIMGKTGERLNKRYVGSGGYAYIGSKPEHKIVMEKILGRELLPGESVHHLNGIKDDNSPDNLELWVGRIRYGQRATDVICPHCGQSYL